MHSILITGGSGFFGQSFTKYLLKENLANRICIYSRCEYKQALMKRDIADDRVRYFIGDVRDPDRLERAMRGCSHVVHAAALKRIEVGAYSPDEMVKTNVLGAMNVIDCAYNADVGTVVALSTDKAYQPVSPYGQTKALAESLFLRANAYAHGPKYSVIRYGNVWRSTGSIVPIWEYLKESGSTKVPVTDPDCTRFFMTADQACDLVNSTLSTMGGELVIPDDLPAYRVGDLAKAMDMGTTITGLPEWEKMHEGMQDGVTSDIARRMTVEELREWL